MRRSLPALPVSTATLLTATLLTAALLTACASTDGPTDRQPRSARHDPAAGFHAVSYHGVSVDVPDAARLTLRPACTPGLPSAGALVVPLFDGGATSCPAQTSDAPGATPRPATELTVLLGPTGSDPHLPLTDPRHVDVADAGVTVTAAGPTTDVDAVFASVRPTPQDDLGCTEQIDPTVAPRNVNSPDGALLPVATSRIVVCEYGRTGEEDEGEDDGPYWLVGSRELSRGEAAAAATRVDAAPVYAAGGDAAPSGPVLRLLVLGADGNTRTLQATMDSDPQAVTDGPRTVAVDPLPGGEYPPLPTPFQIT